MEAVELREIEGAWQGVSIGKFQYSDLMLDMGSLEEALEGYTELIASSKLHREARFESLALVQRAETLRRLGRLGEAYRDISDAERIAANSDLGGMLINVTIVLSEVLSDLGRNEEALERLKSVSPQDPEGVDIEDAVVQGRVRCLALTRLGDYSGAIKCGRLAIRRAIKLSNPMYVARTYRVLSNAYDGTENASEADACRHRALEIFTRLGVPEADELRARLSTVRELSTGSSDRHTPDRPVVRGCPSWSSSWCYSPSPWPWRSPSGSSFS
jgi:tetratricopeptide (TPR) repeat protein